MKKLLSLFVSAVLLSPMWAGAQTTTTPSILGPLHYSGSFEVLDYMLLSLDKPCTNITNLRLNIQSPNNASPIKHVSGYLNCSTGEWLIISGGLVATSGGLPNISNTTTTGYTGTFAVGVDQLVCTFPADLSSAACRLYFSNGNNLGMLGLGTLKYTSAP
jgi:hypothetical protein